MLNDLTALANLLEAHCDDDDCDYIASVVAMGAKYVELRQVARRHRLNGRIASALEIEGVCERAAQFLRDGETLEAKKELNSNFEYS